MRRGWSFAVKPRPTAAPARRLVPLLLNNPAHVVLGFRAGVPRRRVHGLRHERGVLLLAGRVDRLREALVGGSRRLLPRKRWTTRRGRG
jgi:hypothetical protein